VGWVAKCLPFCASFHITQFPKVWPNCPNCLGARARSPRTLTLFASQIAISRSRLREIARDCDLPVGTNFRWYQTDGADLAFGFGYLLGLVLEFGFWPSISTHTTIANPCLLTHPLGTGSNQAAPFGGWAPPFRLSTSRRWPTSAASLFASLPTTAPPPARRRRSPPCRAASWCARPMSALCPSRTICKRMSPPHAPSPSLRRT
jgi:hypothetical protein